MIKLEHPAESLAADDLIFRLAKAIDGVDEFVVERLVIALDIPSNATPQKVARLLTADTLIGADMEKVPCI